MTELININNVTKNFKDPASDIYFQALRGIDLRVEKGEFLSIVGPSGAGKSTLLNILGGMTMPSTGTVFVDSLPLHNLEQKVLEFYRRDIVGFLWQLPERNLLPHLNAYDNLMTSLKIANYPKEKRHTRILEVLESVGLKDRMYHKLGELSGGEAQRASLAVAIVKEPSILLADEPTGELDSATTLEIIKYLRKVNEELDLTVLVVTHDERFEKMTDRSYRILDGTIASIKRSINKNNVDVKSWEDVEREEISVVNQFGQVKIPEFLIEKYGIDEFVQFSENSDGDCICMRPIDKSMEEKL